MAAPTDPNRLLALRYPGERRWLRRTLAMIVLSYLLFTGLTLALWAGWLVVSCITVMVLRSRYPSIALEAGEEQVPRVHRLAQEVAGALGTRKPRVFLLEDPGKRPVFTVPLPEPGIMVNAAWVKMLEEDELRFVLAKEMAHHKLGHRWVLDPIHVLENVGPVSWVLTTPLELARYALRPWMRLAEFSADRVALACLDGRLEVAARVMAKVTAGEELYDEVSGEAFLAQARKLKGGLGLWILEVLTGRIGYGSRLEKLARFADEPRFAELTQGAPPPPKKGLLETVKGLLPGVTVTVES
jgi:Zn-dependent protease with chaperone function